MNSWLKGKIVGMYRKRIVVAILLIAAVVAGLAFNLRYFKNYFSGPAAISREELDKVKDARGLNRYWVNLKADKVHATGFREISVTKRHGVETNRKVSATYFVAEVGERLLLIKAHHKPNGLDLDGYLRPMDDKVDQKFFRDPEAAKLRTAFYPMVLDNEDFKTAGHIGLAVSAAVVLGALYLLFTSFGALRSPENSKLYRKVEGWNPSEYDLNMMEGELKEPAIKFGSNRFSKNYFMQEALLNLKLERFVDVIWAFKQVTTKKIYYIIPAGKTYALIIHTDTESYEIQASEKNVDSVMDLISENCPWLYIGYSDELKAFYDKDKSAMIEEVRKARINPA